MREPTTAAAAFAIFCALHAPARGQGGSAPLRGPEVSPMHVPGLQSEYVPGEAAGPDGRGVPLGVFLGAIRELGAENAPAELRLSDEQSAGIRAEWESFRAELRAYLDAARPRVEQLASRLPEEDRRRVMRAWSSVERTAGALGSDAGEPGPPGRAAGAEELMKAGPETRPKAGGAFRLDFRDQFHPPAEPEPVRPGEQMQSSPEGPDEIRAALREVRDAAPRRAELQSRVWALLTPAQREHLETGLRDHLSRVRREAADRRIAAILEQRASDRAGESAAPQARLDLGEGELRGLLRRVRAGERPELLWSRLPERGRERLDRLTPEERAAALGRLLARRQRGDAGTKTSFPE